VYIWTVMGKQFVEPCRIVVVVFEHKVGFLKKPSTESRDEKRHRGFVMVRYVILELVKMAINSWQFY
jgi:hypothetical protein